MPRPNILLMMTDQQQASTIEPGSPCRTPTLDALAAQGTRFTRAHTVNAICSPTRASLMTGVYPSQHGMVDCEHAVPEFRARYDTSLEMWSQRLAAQGYRCGYFGKWHVERSLRLERFGYREYDVHPSDTSGYAAHRRRLGLGDSSERIVAQYEVSAPGHPACTLYRNVDEPVEGTRPYYLYDRAIDFVQRAATGGEPWCCFVSTSGPGDWGPTPISYADQYDPADIAVPASFYDDLADRPGLYRRAQRIWRDVPWEEHARTIASYYARATLIDEQMGRLLRALEVSGQADDTLVIYCNDHGIMMGAHGLHALGVFPFEEGYRVPLIVRWPGQGVQGQVRHELVNTLDLAPTIMEAMGCAPLAQGEGRSLAPLLKGESPPDWPDDSFAEFHGQRFFYTQRLVWHDRFKYVFNGFDEDELYDLVDDPHEMRNLAAEATHAAVVDEMARRMWAHIRAINDENMLNARYGSLRFAPLGPLG